MSDVTGSFLSERLTGTLKKNCFVQSSLLQFFLQFRSLRFNCWAHQHVFFQFQQNIDSSLTTSQTVVIERKILEFRRPIFLVAFVACVSVEERQFIHRAGKEKMKFCLGLKLFFRNSCCCCEKLFADSYIWHWRSSWNG